MWYQFTVICSLLISIFFPNIVSEKVPFINLEHPRVPFINTNLLNHGNITTTRYGRNNPIYYVGVHFDTKIPFDKNVILDIYFYELLTNVYKISFIHFHYNWCDLLDKEIFIGLPLRQSLKRNHCPLPPGEYHLVNISCISIPRGFPFINGRIYVNVSQAKTKIRIAEGYLDMKVVTMDTKYMTH